jgi:oligopeptide transport system substrate-binding protein
MRVRWAILIAVFAALATTSHAATLRRGTNTEPRSLDPHLGLGNSASLILNDLFEGLVGLDADGKPVPGAAESWTVAGDGLSYRFLLRSGLKWSDGAPLTATDFVYSFRRLLDPATAATFASFLYPIENARAINAGTAAPEQLGARAVDDRTLEIRLTYRAPYFPEIMTANAAAPVPRHVIESHGRGWTEPDTMVSNGAYVLAARVPQTSITARRNPNYHGAAARSGPALAGRGRLWGRESTELRFEVRHHRTESPDWRRRDRHVEGGRSRGTRRQRRRPGD